MIAQQSLLSVRDRVTEASTLMDALLELLGKASSSQINVAAVEVLLRPVQQQLDAVSCDLQDMSL